MIKINNSVFEYEGNDTFSYMLFKWLIKEAGLNLKTAVEKFNAAYPEEKTTPQNISNKLTRDSMKLNEFVKFAEVFGYTIYFDDGKIPANQPEQKKEMKYINLTFYELLAEGFTAVNSINFKTVIIAGANAEKAAEYIESNLFDGMSEPEELLLMVNAKKEFGVDCKPATFDKRA